MSSTNLEQEKIANIFNLYTKYRFMTYNSIISSDNQIYKFKQLFQNFIKIFGEMESKKYIQKEPEQIQIIVKEGKDKKVYTSESITENEPKEEIEEKEEKELNQITKEENIEKEEKANSEVIPKINPGEKTFVVLGGYPDIVNAIAKRGWKQSKNPEDKSYDFLYTLKNADIPFTELKPNQLVNHYYKANQITRKSSLLKNLRNLYFKNVCIDKFYPRAYELSDKSDLEDFIEDFKTNRAICILKNTLENKGENVNKEEVLTSLDIIKRKLNFITNANKDIISKKFENLKNKPFPSINNKDQKNKNISEYEIPIITDKEWEIISNENMEIYSKEIFDLEKSKMLPIKPEREHLHKIKPKNKKIVKEKKGGNNTNHNNKENKAKNFDNNKKEGYIMSEEDKKLEEEIKATFKKQQEERDLEKKKFEQKLLEEEIKKRMMEDELEEKKLEEEEAKKELKEKESKKILTPEEKEEKWRKETFLNNTSNNERPTERPKQDSIKDLLPEIESILKKLSENLPQYVLEGSKNIWIVKPGGLSRGRGVHCIDQLNDILSNVKPCNQTIIQKYIENPLIINGRKFDIRQWVLVTDLNPLTVWIFETPYVRFGAENYHIDDFKNVFSQLTGNSIAKHSEKFNTGEIEGDMWENEQFREFLKNKYGGDPWIEIQKKIEKIAILSLQSAKHKLFNRKNNFEVFGFDIMLDDKLNVYLIEINASPDWTYSTKVTEKLVKIASDDIMKVVLDLPKENLKPENERQKVDTGRFRQIFCSSSFPNFGDIN